MISLATAVDVVAPFERAQVSPDYYAEGAAVGDFDKDGVLDITSGPLWWAGPDFAVAHSIYAGAPAPVLGYSAHFTSHVMDVDGDGWDDVVAIGFPSLPARWFENPGGVGAWVEHVLYASVGAESPTFADIVPGGLPELVCADGNVLGFLAQDAADVAAPWLFHPIAAATFPLTFLHGLGVGDLNADGRDDVLTGFGWLEQPPALAGDPLWTLHAYNFGVLGGSQMYADDIDGDGDLDLVSSIDAHGYGLSWFESSGGAPPTFIEHEILPRTALPPATGQFSQLHALELVDIDGDGLRDIVTGKCPLAHNGADPGAFDPAVLYWFRLDRSTTPPTFVPHLVDSDSGVGRQVVVRDVNGDTRPDIVVGNKKGVFVFTRLALWSSVLSVDLTSGGTQPLSLDAGAANGGRVYLIAGSASGTSPGVPFGGAQVPLNPDAYTTFALGALNSNTFVGFLGALDATGRAEASLVVPAGLAHLGPLALHHAFLAFDAAGQLTFVSNTLALSLL